MDQPPAVLTRGLTKSYGVVPALRGVDLEVRRGEIFGFLGPNGAGKTTTIRCLLDLIRPSGGRLSVLGLDPQAEPLAVRARAIAPSPSNASTPSPSMSSTPCWRCTSR